MNPEDLTIVHLGPRQVLSPLQLSTVAGDGIGDFVSEDARVPCAIEYRAGQAMPADLAFEKAGPRQHLFFRPEKTKAAIVTCGGLCPGLNNVIRSVFLELNYNYGVPEVYGIRYGYWGLNPAHETPPLRLTPQFVDHIHKDGGTVLGSSRGPEKPEVVVDFLQREGFNILFCVGGDGTQRGARAIAAEAIRRQAPIAVVGIPKTIDNDLPFVWRSFGYGTALERAKDVIDCAHMEARGALNGVGLVKLMGRESGFIAAGATLASQEVNFTLIPEVPFPLEGEDGFLAALRRRILARSHAVVVVAEGAGQHLMGEQRVDRDASGNLKLHDVGPWLQQQIQADFKAHGVPLSLKYIDPSYTIRSVPANSDDSLLCNAMARHAVHAAMAGKTGLLIGMQHNLFVHVPIALATSIQKRLSPEGELWRGVLEATGQPRWR